MSKIKMYEKTTEIVSNDVINRLSKNELVLLVRNNTSKLNISLRDIHPLNVKETRKYFIELMKNTYKKPIKMIVERIVEKNITANDINKMGRVDLNNIAKANNFDETILRGKKLEELRKIIIDKIQKKGKSNSITARSFSEIFAEELIKTIETTPTEEDKTLYYIERAIEDLNKNLKDVDFEFSDIITFYEPSLFSFAFTEQGEAILNIGKELIVPIDLSEVISNRLSTIKLNENSKNMELKIIPIEEEDDTNTKLKEVKLRVLCRITIPETLLVTEKGLANINWKDSIKNADAIAKNLIAIFK